MQLTPEQVATYWRDGFLALPGFFPHDHTAALRARLEVLIRDWQGEAAQRVGASQEPGLSAAGVIGSAATLRKFSDLAPHEPLFMAHACHPSLLDVVAQLIGTPLLLYADQALLKPPHHGSEKPEHQDNAYFRVRPADQVITCWAALDDADLENGCMHYYPGSHRSGEVRHHAIKGTPHLIPHEEGTGERFQPGRRSESVAVPIGEGGLVLHHSQTVHWTPANHSSRWRRAFVCHYVRRDAEMPARHPNSPPLPEVRA